MASEELVPIHLRVPRTLKGQWIKRSRAADMTLNDWIVSRIEALDATGDEAAGIAWWNELTEPTRLYWLKKVEAQGGSVAAAWAAFKLEAKGKQA